MHLPVELLETFVTVAETKNFTTAGKRINRSQSAVSMQMKRLTEIVGSPLFDSNGKRIRLSPMGELLLDHARKILKAHETAATAITRSELKGKVRFGATEDYASLFVPDILAGFAEEYPDIRVDVICMPSVQLYADLLQDKLDLALCTALDAVGEEVLAEPVVWVTGMDEDALAQGSVPLAVYGHDCMYRKWAVQALERIGRPFHIAYMSPSISGILAAVRSGLAVAPVGLNSVPRYARIVKSREGFPGLPEASISLHKKADSDNPLVEKLAVHVRASVGHGSCESVEADRV
ncbi:MAG: LysR family transcriptional regulator [Desulfarculaceae bacterium]|nr:LysR family transcriptional regulator [Desulfarculaceae bacterium]